MASARREVATVVKLGGAALTDKATKETLSEDGMRDGLGAVREAYVRLRTQGRGLVVVHGAGSFGHHSAREFGLKSTTFGRPFETDGRDERRFHGAAETRRSVSKLNGMLVARLCDLGVPAIGMSPLSLGWFAASSESRELGGARVIRDAVAAGFLPVLHGDLVFRGNGDGTTAVRILSGDEIVFMLARAFSPSVVTFLSDVDGVYTMDPKKHADGARLLRSVSADCWLRGTRPTDERDTAPAVHEPAAANDVTGRMEGKLLWACRCKSLLMSDGLVRIASALRFNSQTSSSCLACLPDAAHDPDNAFTNGDAWVGTEIT